MIPTDPLPESRFTRATPFCPNPQRWTSTDDDSTEIEVSALLAGLVRGLQPSLCIETGTAWGQTAQAIGQALIENGHGRLVSLDIDPERVAYSRDRCAGLPVEIVEAPSVAYEPAAVVEFAFFDSLFPLRLEEFAHFSRWMRPGTIVSFHDSAPYHGGGQFPNPQHDLRTELELIEGLRVIHFPTPRGLTLGEVQ